MSPSLSTGGDAAGGEGTAGPRGARRRDPAGICPCPSRRSREVVLVPRAGPGAVGAAGGGVVLAADRELMVEVVERKSWASCRGVVGGVGLRAVVSRAGSWRCHGAAHGVPGKYGVL